MIRLIEVLVFAAWNFFTVGCTVNYFVLRKRMRALKDPVLELSRRERRERARKLLQRQDDEYEQQMVDRITNQLKGNPW